MDVKQIDTARPLDQDHDIEFKNDAHGGTGSFVTRSINLNAVIFSAKSEDGVKALSNASLKDTCYHCVVVHSDNGVYNTERTGLKPLKVCSGCKIVRYCSAQCQKSSWTDAHKHECKIFKKLYPRVLPSNVRAIMRLLLGDDAEGSNLKGILQMQDHLKHFQERGGQQWQDLCLSAKAAKAYSGTKIDEATVLRLCGILHTNSFTLVTPTYDPIGVALHPKLGYMNHSCEYNATVRFGKYGHAEVIPIRPIQAGEEILISYVDELLPYTERQAELKERYFFTCRCPRCERESSTPSPPPAAVQRASLLVSAANQDPDAINSALSNLHTASWEPTAYPIPSLRQQLITAYLSDGSYNLAFVHAMIQCFQLDPLLYPAAHHPVRMIHAWLCVRIIDHLLETDLGSQAQTEKQQKFSLAPFDVNLEFWRRAIVVSLHRSTNIVAPGDFSKMVDLRYNEDKAQWTRSEKTYQEQYAGKEILETNWGHVQQAIDVVMKKEKGG
jgi:hypothetical protein